MFWDAEQKKWVRVQVRCWPLEEIKQRGLADVFYFDYGGCAVYGRCASELTVYAQSGTNRWALCRMYKRKTECAQRSPTGIWESSTVGE